MNITVNNISLELHNGARVKDAILKYYSQQKISIPGHFPPVEDPFGNELVVTKLTGNEIRSLMLAAKYR